MFRTRLNSKTFRLAVLLIALLIMLGACTGKNSDPHGNGEPPQDPEVENINNGSSDPNAPEAENSRFDWAKGKEKSNFTGYTVRMNNLQYNEMNGCDDYPHNPTGPLCYRSAVQIEGLKNKELQEEINIKISDKVNEFANLKRLPNVQGIKALAAKGLESEKLYYRNVYAIPQCKMGNILSVAVYSYNEYEFDDSERRSLSECETFNIDLNTGKEICMLDLFADYVDGMQYLNDAVDKAILEQGLSDEPDMYMYFDHEHALSLAGRFTGLQEDQKYYLNGTDGNLVLVFDHENPEFHASTGYSELRVDITEVAAFDRFLLDGENIYDSDKVVYNLLQRPLKPDPNLSMYQKYIELPELSGSIWIDTEIYEDLNKAQQRFLSVYDEDIVEIQNLLYEKLRNYEKQYGLNSIQSFGSIYSNGSRYGNYINLRRDESHGMSLKYNWTTVYYSDISEERCYKVGRNEPLKIEDIFKDSANWRDYVAPAIAKRMLDQFSPYASLDPDLMLRMGTDLLDYCTGFSIRGDALNLSYSPPADFIYRYLPAEAEIPPEYYFASYITFEDLGCENLNIF